MPEAISLTFSVMEFVMMEASIRLESNFHDDKQDAIYLLANELSLS